MYLSEYFNGYINNEVTIQEQIISKVLVSILLITRYQL